MSEGRNGGVGPARWPAGGGEMAALIRAHDWATTSLGPIEVWPQGLRTAVDICLDSGFASFVWWGPDLIQFYNDAALPIVRAKHPASFAAPAKEAWSDVWGVIGPFAERVVETGEPVLGEDMPMVPERGGLREVAYFTFSYSALRDETGSIAGMSATAIETTDKVREAAGRRESEERQAFLLELNDAIGPLSDPVGIQGEATRLLGERLDVGRCYYFEADPEAGQYVIHRDYLRGGANSIAGSFAVEDWPLMGEAFVSGEPLVISDVATTPLVSTEERASVEARDIRALIVVSLVKQGRFVAALVVAQAEPRAWTDGEVALVGEVAERTWAAVERARAEELMRRSEEKYRGIFDSIDEGFVVAELLFDEEAKPFDLLVLEANASFDRMMRTTDAVGKRAKEIFPDAEASWFEAYGRVVTTGKSLRIENYLAPLDSWFELYISRIGGAGSRRFAIVFNDITERKLAELNTRFLVKLDAELNTLTMPAEIEQTVTKRLSEFLHVSRCFFAHIKDGLGSVRHEYRDEDVSQSVIAEHPLNDYISPEDMELFVRGETLVVNDVVEDPRTSPLATNFARIQMRAFVSTPGLVGGE
jgi:GAF domain-containing protein